MFSGYEGSLIRMSQICGMSTAAHQLDFCRLWCSHVKPLASYVKGTLIFLVYCMDLNSQ